MDDSEDQGPQEERSQPSAGDTEFPVAFGSFARALVGTPDEIWIKWLQLQHGAEKHTPTEWRDLIDDHRSQPAYQQ